MNAHIPLSEKRVYLLSLPFCLVSTLYPFAIVHVYFSHSAHHITTSSESVVSDFSCSKPLTTSWSWPSSSGWVYPYWLCYHHYLFRLCLLLVRLAPTLTLDISYDRPPLHLASLYLPIYVHHFSCPTRPQLLQSSRNRILHPIRFFKLLRKMHKH